MTPSPLSMLNQQASKIAAMRIDTTSYRTLLLCLVYLGDWSSVAWTPSPPTLSFRRGRHRERVSDSWPDPHFPTSSNTNEMQSSFASISSLQLSSSSSLWLSEMEMASPWVVAFLALGLGVAAQGFINQMLKGDQGLGAFLKDGSGYNKSGFRRRTSSDTESGPRDPLPWLKLPQLDFVEVAGQPTISPADEQALYERLEALRIEMNEKLEEGQTVQAKALRDELEQIMSEAGIEYTASDGANEQ